MRYRTNRTKYSQITAVILSKKLQSFYLMKKKISQSSKDEISKELQELRNGDITRILVSVIFLALVAGVTVSTIRSFLPNKKVKEQHSSKASKNRKEIKRISTVLKEQSKEQAFAEPKSQDKEIPHSETKMRQRHKPKSQLATKKKQNLLLTDKNDYRLLKYLFSFVLMCICLCMLLSWIYN